jgi:nucleolar protein 12
LPYRPNVLMSTQPMQKQLKRHILSFVPGAKIESVRFRSIAFQSPTSKLPDDEGAAASKKKPADKDGRQHDKERAASWRAVQDKDEVTLAQDAKKFLSAEAKKKIAFIKGELHTSAQTANAYIVFAHGRPHTSGPDDGGSDAEESAAAGTSTTQTDPYKAARAAIRDANGSVFLERTIRVDRVAGKAAIADDADPKRTVFVGNLDFASQEEDLRVFFEGVVSTERGPPPTSDDADEDEEGAGKKAVSWVAHVRIVRDKDTQLGKGFAYVQFVVSL